jgi:cbb3-type cytochrome c oxidase subunit III
MVAPNPANGATIYAEKCVPCHGSSGQGDGPQAVDLPNPVAALGSPDVARKATPASWYNQVTKGNLQRFMPPFNSLSDRERWDVVAYSFSLSIPQETLSQGEMLYAANCAGCHGEKGQGDGPQATGLAMPPTAFTDQARMSQKTTADFYTAITDGVPPAMPAFESHLNEQDRWALADYLRMIPFSETGEPVAAAAATAQVTSAARTSASPEAVTPAAEQLPGSCPDNRYGHRVTNGSGGSSQGPRGDSARFQ